MNDIFILYYNKLKRVRMDFRWNDKGKNWRKDDKL
jgi:hypothetical protein